jgi:hypothetical protein
VSGGDGTMVRDHGYADLTVLAIGAKEAEAKAERA